MSHIQLDYSKLAPFVADHELEYMQTQVTAVDKHYVKVQELVMILLAGLIYQKTMTKKNSRALKKQQQKFNLTLRY